jgi:alpha-tubulin suppressor-like RCC1 family protein
LLTQDGYVYSMGFNNYGVLGLGQSEFQLAHVASP